VGDGITGGSFSANCCGVVGNTHFATGGAGLLFWFGCHAQAILLRRQRHQLHITPLAHSRHAAAADIRVRQSMRLTASTDSVREIYTLSNAFCMQPAGVTAGLHLAGPRICPAGRLSFFLAPC